MKNDNILITGGAGFLGSHFIDLLNHKGYKNITVVDKYKLHSNKAKYIQGDFADEMLIKPLLNKCVGLFHFAAMVGVDNCRNNPELLKKINLINTKKLIDWSSELGVKHIIFTSSSEVYGNSRDIPYREDSELEPVSDYGKAKADIEKYLKIIQKKSTTTVGIVRPFNAYGPRQKANFVVPLFIEAAKQNKPLVIFGKGQQTRSFTYVRDITEGILGLYEYNKTPYEIINIGSNQEYSIEKLAKIVLEYLPESSSEIIYMQHGQRGIRNLNLEVDRRVPSIDKAKNLIKFEAKISLRDGLNKMINSYV